MFWLLFLAAAATPADCAAAPIAVEGVASIECSEQTTFDYAAFEVDQHFKRFSPPPSPDAGSEAFGTVHAVTGSDGSATVHASLATARQGSHVRFVTDLRAWAGAGRLRWRAGRDRNWSESRAMLTPAGTWYYATFSWQDRECVTALKFAELAGNGYRHAISVTGCGLDAADDESAVRNLVGRVRANLAWQD